MRRRAVFRQYIEAQAVDSQVSLLSGAGYQSEPQCGLDFLSVSVPPVCNYRLFDDDVHSLQYLKLQSQPQEPHPVVRVASRR